MDRNSIVGLLLIGSILLGWMYFTAPSAEELAQRRQKDSLERVELDKKNKKNAVIAPVVKDTATVKGDSVVVLSDSAKAAIRNSAFGVFAAAATGKSEELFIENELIRVNLTTKGGRIGSVQLKEYKRHDGTPLMLFDADSSVMALRIYGNNIEYITDSFYFQASSPSVTVTGDQSKSISMRLYAEGNKNKYVEFIYSLKGNSYLLDYKIKMVGMQEVVSPTREDMDLLWSMKVPSQEKSIDNQRIKTTIYYKFKDEDATYMSEGTDEEKALEGEPKWIAFKQQFFTSVLIAGDKFGKPSTLRTQTERTSKKYVRGMSAEVALPYLHQASETNDLQFYFGPNHFRTLKKLDLGLEKQIPLGWGIFGWVNRFIVIPIFNFLNSFNMNYGLVILILTLLIKLLLFPIAYKTYLSSAKMRVLKPEIDEINKKYEKEEPMKKQQATMALYRKAGVNPLAGCIPLLLQMPILIALFNFFPSSIELRQQGFLWADDLSTYDSVYNFGFSIPFYGDHVSLFTLLMTVSTVLYTWSNSQLMGSQQQMPGMKFMMYFMPVIFLGVMNNYSAGLSYYYFLANMITFGQTFAMRRFVDEDALRRKIEDHKKKPVKVSSFQQRLEKMAKERQQQSRKK